MANSIEEATKAVEELECSRDTVFGKERDATLKKMAEAVLKLVPDADNLKDAVERANVLSIRGRAMGVIPAESRDTKECDMLLSKSVKMNPKCVATWNALGHLRWEQSKLKDALAAYDGGLESVPNNKIALRNSALILRSLGGKENIEKAVERSKAALALDFSDGVSWYTHGMVHLSKYFCWTFNQADLRAALKAFNLSDKQCESRNPDVAFNRGQCQQYMILWEEALEGISKAIEIDPTFTEAINAKADIETFFETITRKWNCYAGYNEKTLTKLIKSLPQTGTKTLRGNTIEVLPLSALEATEGCIAEAKGVVVKVLECVDNTSMPVYYLACGM
eukprot:TRINITY_DN10129_c0_g1_i3.p1 TRINITY_DN10129_c0_g1~~TRINITY_DN10129_c0_g1_i3.p1  ORF type:complete len:336 (+),score=73.48 TRINITY_DN10129_c0_g1_i3:84-1091(+)